MPFSFSDGCRTDRSPAGAGPQPYGHTEHHGGQDDPRHLRKSTDRSRPPHRGVLPAPLPGDRPGAASDPVGRPVRGGDDRAKPPDPSGPVAYLSHRWPKRHPPLGRQGAAQVGWCRARGRSLTAARWRPGWAGPPPWRARRRGRGRAPADPGRAGGTRHTPPHRPA